MALPDKFKNAQGTAVIWKSSGGDGAFTATSLASGSARQGAKVDLGALWDRRFHVFFETKMTSAPANGTGVELWWAPSTNATAGTSNPGGASGTDAAFSNPDEASLQLMLIGRIALSNAIGTGLQAAVFEFYPPARYGMPVVVNRGGVALSATAGDHVITLTPIIESVED